MKAEFGIVLLMYLDSEINRAKEAIDILTKNFVDGTADKEVIERRLTALGERYQAFLEVRNKCRVREMEV